jgi:hypothetical protein
MIAGLERNHKVGCLQGEGNKTRPEAFGGGGGEAAQVIRRRVFRLWMVSARSQALWRLRRPSI